MVRILLLFCTLKLHLGIFCKIDKYKVIQNDNNISYKINVKNGNINYE